MLFVVLLCKRLLLVLVLFSSCRLVYYGYNYNSFEALDTGNLLLVFTAGLRFDIAAIMYINTLIILLHVLPFNFRFSAAYQRFCHAVFLIFNSLAILLEFIDIAYYPYAYRRLLGNDFKMHNDIKNHLGQYFTEFWPLLLLLLCCIFVLYRFYPSLNKSIQHKPRFVSQLFLMPACIFCMIVLMRGGFQLRPLMPIDASSYVRNTQHMSLVSNTCLGLVHSFQQQQLQYKGYFDDEEQISNYFTIERQNRTQKITNKNIVILVCESLGDEFIGYSNSERNLTPFLNQLIGKGLYFENMYANGSRSTQGIAAILGGIPALMDDPYIFSAYQMNTLRATGSVLKEIGYRTAFFHGGEVGTMGFNNLMPLVGVDAYYGRQQYIADNGFSLEKDYDGNWGIWDIPFYDYALNKINSFRAPFFTTLFSINVHHPFNTESWFEKEYPALTNVNRSIRYSDYNLQLFFEKAVQQDWYNNTLFIITADHTGPSSDKRYSNNHGRYKIPLLLYCPSDSSLRGSSNAVAQQIDIMPTVLEYIGYSGSFKSFGQSLFSKMSDHCSFSYEKGIYQLITQQFILQFDGEKSIGLYSRVEDDQMQNNLIQQSDYKNTIKQHENKLKAVIQLHHQHLINNTLY